MMMTGRDIVVGVDGSAPARAALHWAAAEAARHERSLRIVCAYQWPWPGAPMVPAGDGLADPDLHRRARERVDEAVADARRTAPGVAVDGEAVPGGAAVVPVGASRGAAMTVVGSRGRGGFAGLLLGSVSAQVVAHAAGPVVVVRSERAFDAGPVGGGRD